MSYTSAKGYRGEVAVLDLLGRYSPDLYRPRAGNPHDKGDILGGPMVHSVKNCNAFDLAYWVDSMAGMVANANRETGVVWAHRRGKAHAMDYYVITSGRLFVPLYLAYLDSKGWPRC